MEILIVADGQRVPLSKQTPGQMKETIKVNFSQTFFKICLDVLKRRLFFYAKE